MNKPKAWTMAAISLAVGIASYGVLKLIAPYETEDIKLEGLVPAEAVFGDDTPAAAAPAEVAAAPAEAPAEMAREDPVATIGAELAPPPDEPQLESAAAPATAAPEPAATAPEPAPAPPAAPATKPAMKAEPKPEAKPEPKPAPKPVAKTESRPATKPAAAKPAAAPAPSTVAAPATTAWWQGGSPNGLQVVYVGSASFKRAIVVLGNAPFAGATAGDQAIAVIDANGRQLSGSWEQTAVNPSMLVFPVSAPGVYQVIIGGSLSDARNRTLGVSLRGPVRVN